MNWLERWIRKKVREEWNKWLMEQTGQLTDLGNKLYELQQQLSHVHLQIAELETIKMKVPIEEYILNSKRFETSLQEAHERARQIWPYNRDLESFLPTITGTVGPNQPFECIINEHFIVVVAGLKTRYVSEQGDEALYRMQIADRWTRPFSVDVETRQVIFLKPYVLSEEQFFSIRQNAGTGTLNFSVIGATISHRYTYGRREYELWGRSGTSVTCFICGRTIHNRDAIADAKLLEKYTGQRSGVLCCSCFKVIKTIDEGKGGG